jgi:hypothetical protein
MEVGRACDDLCHRQASQGDYNYNTAEDPQPAIRGRLHDLGQGSGWEHMSRASSVGCVGHGTLGGDWDLHRHSQASTEGKHHLMVLVGNGTLFVIVVPVAGTGGSGGEVCR